MICGKEGVFLDPKYQRFLFNRGLFKTKVSEKGGIFSTWRTLMGFTNFTRVGVPGYTFTAGQCGEDPPPPLQGPESPKPRANRFT